MNRRYLKYLYGFGVIILAIAIALTINKCTKNDTSDKKSKELKRFDSLHSEQADKYRDSAIINIPNYDKIDSIRAAIVRRDPFIVSKLDSFESAIKAQQYELLRQRRSSQGNVPSIP